MASIKETVLDILREDPSLDNESVADMVRQRVPGATTTAASVSSIKLIARRDGELNDVEVHTTSQFKASNVFGIIESVGETEEVIRERLSKRFATLDRMINHVIGGTLPSLIISGPAGLGKSYGVRKALRKAEETSGLKFDMISGSITAVGLYIALWNMRDGGVVILDDCDDVFRDETTMNILKAALDSGDERVISWRKKSSWLKDEQIDDRFEFKGRVIFLTNVDFEGIVTSGRADAVHFKALMDRSLYLNLTMRTLDDYMVRIRQVAVEGGMLMRDHGLLPEDVDTIIEFISKNRTRFYHLSLRLVHQIAVVYKASDEWQTDLEVTKMKVDYK